MRIPLIRRPARAAAIVALALCTGLTACGGEDGPTPVAAASGSALFSEIPTLGEEYPAQLARFVDTAEGKDYGLAVTRADDGNVVAYLCDGKTLGRAFSGTIADGANAATLKAVTGDGTVDLTLSGGEPTSATVKTADVSDDFELGPTQVGGYFREQVKGVTRGWVVSDALELKGIQTADEAGGKSKTTTSGVSSPPLSAEEQQLVGAQEDASAPPETQAFLKARRCARLKRQYDTAAAVFGPGQEPAPSQIGPAANAANLALARGSSLGCDWSGDVGFID